MGWFDEPYLYDSSSHQIPPIPALYHANSYFLGLFCISGVSEAQGGNALKRRHFHARNIAVEDQSQMSIVNSIFRLVNSNFGS
ncbi:unnamed protein product [Rhodiola kirilowii]